MTKKITQKVLTAEEMAELEKQISQLRSTQTTSENFKQKCEIVDLKIELYREKTENLGHLRKEFMAGMNREMGQNSALRKKHQDFLSSLKKKYKISQEKWGYNPDSGEIL